MKLAARTYSTWKVGVLQCKIIAYRCWRRISLTTEKSMACGGRDESWQAYWVLEVLGGEKNTLPRKKEDSTVVQPINFPTMMESQLEIH